MKKFLALMLAVIMVVSMFTACGKKGYTSDNTEFVIGCSGPLTGGAAVYGVAVQNSAQMAVDEINAAGGLNGIKFKLVMLDDNGLNNMIKGHIDQGTGAARAVEMAMEEYCNRLKSIGDEYLTERTSDIRDVLGRVVDILDGRNSPPIFPESESLYATPCGPESKFSASMIHGRYDIL